MVICYFVCNSFCVFSGFYTLGGLVTRLWEKHAYGLSVSLRFV